MSIYRDNAYSMEYMNTVQQKAIETGMQCRQRQKEYRIDKLLQAAPTNFETMSHYRHFLALSLAILRIP